VERRKGNLAFRHQFSDARDSEIVAFTRDENNMEYCYTLLFWRRGSEGYSIEFVGNRPFETTSLKAFWSLAKYGQAILDAEFILEKEAHGPNY
jgi:hypothetical protein